MNQLILGDNLEILKSLDSETIDLIYLDPPFFSNRNYEVIWGDAGEIRSFQDRWSGGIDHYIAWLKDRVFEMHRLLKPTGSIFLHCDWHANAYIRVFILDKIFGETNFRGEIVWKRHNSHNDARKKLAVLKDTIWYYSKSEKNTYHAIYSGHSEDYKGTFYKYNDDDGKGTYTLADMASPNPRPNMMYEWMGFSFPVKGWRYERETMQKLHDQERIYYPKQKDGSFDFTKRPRLKRYLKEQQGQLAGDVWTDIQNLQAHSKERIGYPTQKPEALIERIITMASNENDVILDPFVGGGTTVVVADKLKRNWIGIDQSVQAVKVSEMRLQKQQDLFSKPFVMQLHKYDYDTLRYKDAFQFESWIIQQLGGTANLKQRSDLGIDGRSQDGLAIQVKRSDNIGREVVDKFQSACKRFDNHLFEKQVADQAPVGIIIAFSFGKGAIQEIARLKNEENTIIQLLKVEEIVPIAKKPKLNVIFTDLGLDNKKMREIEFTAHAESDAGIEFFAWDFSYEQPEGFKADVLIDKVGKQTQTFKTGSHIIAVKVVDNEGLENFEILRLKINGLVTG
ncbi:MAG: site-specific DNA-methyltransferase [Thiotrichaceae bacterium]